MSLRRRTSRLVSTMSVVVACLLAGGVLTGAEAQPAKQLPNLLVDKPATGQAGSTKADSTKGSKKPGDDLPPKPPIENVTGLYAYIDKTEQSVKKAKVTFNVPPLNSFAWISQVLEQPVDPQYVWADATGLIYVVSPKGESPNYGIFPTVKVKMLAFGAIPVSADVHISQAFAPGAKYPTPLTLKLRFTYSFSLTPDPITLPCGPASCSYTESPTITGPATVRIDNIKIDGVPLDVGSNCRTASPAQLNLHSPAGYYGPHTSPVYYPDNLYLPFNNGGTLTGTADVPAFTGCTNGSEDLSRLLTGMVSGPGNPLTVHQDGPLTPTPHPLTG